MYLQGIQLVAGAEGEDVVGQFSIVYADVGSDEEVGRINLCDIRNSFSYFVLNECYLLGIAVVQI